MRAVVSLLVASSLLLCLPAGATSSLSAPAQQKLLRLEKKYFDDNFSTESDEVRIERLEKLVFGEAIPGAPQERVERLISVIASETGDDLSSDNSFAKTDSEKNPAAAASGQKDSGGQDDREEDNTPVASQDDYPHVTALENAILGQSFAGQTLSQRFSRMETKAFGTPSNNPDFSQRTDALEKYAEKSLHKQPFGAEKATPAVAQSSGMSQQLLTLAGNSLLSMAGMGFSGVRVRPRQEVQEEPASQNQAQAPDEEPEVYENMPPPADAKLIVKVGWCEVQTFGHTFPRLHLLGRLGQLNQELKVKPGESNMQLMDDIGAMMKAAQLRKSASAR